MERQRLLQGKHFQTSMTLLVEWRGEHEPSVPSLAESRDGIEDGSALAEWHAAAQTELDPKLARYASAIKRITNETPTFYHAFAYRDHTVLADLWHRIPWMRDWGMDTLLSDPEVRQEIWEVILQMSEFARLYHMFDVQVPTRSEINANIQSHRASKQPQKPAMGRGFDSIMEELMTTLDISPFKLASNVDRVALWTEEMKAMDIDSIIREKNWKQLRDAEFKHDEFARVFGRVTESTDPSFWSKLSTLNSFAGVQHGIPTNMMSKIETTAHRLAGEIATGRTDMNQLNIAELGRSVLEDCDPKEMEAFTSNMGNLLPLLTNLQSNMMSATPANLPTS